MLLAIWTNLDEATIVERVRANAAQARAGHALTQQAVEEAIDHFRAQGVKHKDVNAAVFAGVLFLNQFLLDQRRAAAIVAASLSPKEAKPAMSLARVPFGWVESWWFIAAALAVAAAIGAARSFGLLS